MQISRIISGAINLLDSFERFKNDAERRAVHEANKIKRRIIMEFFQWSFFALSLLLVLAGVLLFFTRFFPGDLVILVSGVILLYVAMIIGLLKKKRP
mgnify:CR=1 FL=1